MLARPPSGISMMPIDVNQANRATLPDRSSEQWFALFWLLLGALCLVIPATTTFATETVLVGILFVAGVAKCVLALLDLRSPDTAWLFAGGLVVALLAAIRVFFPAKEIVSFSAFLAVFFLLQGLLSLRFAYRRRNHASESRLDLIGNGAMNLALVVFIVFGWPQPAGWLPAVLLGASMISLSVAIWGQTAAD